jgi:hypothetical protein
LVTIYGSREQPVGVTLPGMALRGWGGSVAVATGVAAATGAAQLGLAYGTGVVVWPLTQGDTAEHAWVTSLTWATWIAATSTIAGAVIAARLRPLPAGPDGSPDQLSRVLWRLVLVVSAAIGALLTVLLTAVPARDVTTGLTVNPPVAVAGFALLGVLFGVLLALGALWARAIAANLIATGAWLWVLAVVVVGEGVAAGRELPGIPLGFWELDLGEAWFRDMLFPDSAIPLGAALVVGTLAALPAARRGDHPIGVVISGATGPLLVAVAYLLAQPDLATLAVADASRHLVAPYLVLAGLAGSLLSTAVRPRTSADDQHSDGPTGAGAKVPGARPAAEQSPARSVIDQSEPVAS